MSDETRSGKKQAMMLNPKDAGLEVSKMEGRHQKEEEEKDKAKVWYLPNVLFVKACCLFVLLFLFMNVVYFRTRSD